MTINEIKKFAKLFDHTNLKAEATREDIKQLCEEAKENHFGAVCVNPSYVALAKELLLSTELKIATVIGFPLGATLPHVKQFEAQQAIKQGADEIDMVINIGAVKNNDFELVEKEISAVLNAAGEAITKVILETCYLTHEEIIQGCIITQKCGAQFVKTSTGFGSGGAKAEHIRLMRSTVGTEMGIKASGGIRDYRTAKEMIEAGATRIGASASVSILNEFKNNLLEKKDGI